MEDVDWTGKTCAYDTTKTIIQFFESYSFVLSLLVYHVSFS